MDPLTAIGLAGNLLQFIELATKIISKGNRIRQSADGLLEEYHDLEIVTRDLLVLQAKLKPVPDAADNFHSDEDREMNDLLDASNELASKLLTRLNMAKAQGRYRGWKSLRQALKSVTSKDEVEDMARRLSTFRDEFQTRILVSLR
jgi:hypothetical protein